MNQANRDHFQGKDAKGHLAEAKVQGTLAATEIHGTETPGHLSAAADSARDTAVVLLLLWTLLTHLNLPFQTLFSILALFGLGWIVWKGGRSAWLGWFRLERLHRVLEQERWEIQHNRKQEREELGEMYAAKGFEGKLLEEVLDVLMADDSRLLRVMVEEELGLTLLSQEHPLKQGLGAFIGGAISLVLCLLSLSFFSPYGVALFLFLVVGISGALSAYQGLNRFIPAIFWNIGLSVLSFSLVYYLLDFFVK